MCILKKLDRAHRMTGSDPGDPTCATLYSEAAAAIREARGLTDDAEQIKHRPTQIAPAGRVSVDSGLVVSMVRYALGRATYVVSWTISEMRAIWPDLLERDQHIIISDITAELKDSEAAGRTVGMRMDHDEWRAFLHDVDALTRSTPEPGAPTAMQLADAALEQYGRVVRSGMGTNHTEDKLAQALIAVLARGTGA